MNQKDMLTKIAQLESINDYLITELEQLDGLMKMIGFKGGIFTVKETANEILRKGIIHFEESF